MKTEAEMRKLAEENQDGFNLLIALEFGGYQITHRGRRVVRPNGEEIGSFRGIADIHAWIVLDCPNYLDPANINPIWALVQKLREKGKGLVIDTLFDEDEKAIVVSNRTDEGIPCEGWEWEYPDCAMAAESLNLAVCLFMLWAAGKMEVQDATGNVIDAGRGL